MRFDFTSFDDGTSGSTLIKDGCVQREVEGDCRFIQRGNCFGEVVKFEIGEDRTHKLKRIAFFQAWLNLGQKEDAGIKVIDHFTYAIFCLLVLMCFGEKLDEHQINEISRVQRDMLLKIGSGRFTVLSMLPRLGKILFRNRWKEFEHLREDREQVLIPLIQSRIKATKIKPQFEDDRIVAYVDSLVNLQLPEEEGNNEINGKLTDKEMASMCGEFLNAGTDTTSTALQWIMANLVKHPDIQSKLYDEIVSVVGPPPPPLPPGEEPESVINEDELKKMPYLKATN
ncbi:hypothetical protein LXL04_014765 [Taraxacum kok-saghyz]